MTGNGFKAMCLVLATTVYGCGPLRLDATPQIRGSVVGVKEQRLSIRHKTGQTYHVALTPETRIHREDEALAVSDMCPGQRAVVFLSPSDRRAASEVRLFGEECR
jgi:hypothetical protein